MIPASGQVAMSSWGEGDGGGIGGDGAEGAEGGVPFRAGEGGFPLRRNSLASWAAFQAAQSRLLENQRMGW